MNRDHMMGYTGHLRALLGDEFPQQKYARRDPRPLPPPGHAEAMRLMDHERTKELPNPKAKKAPYVKRVGTGVARITYNGVELAKSEHEIADSGVNGILHKTTVVIDGESVPMAVDSAVREALAQSIDRLRGLSIGFREPQGSIRDKTTEEVLGMYEEIKGLRNKDADFFLKKVLETTAYESRSVHSSGVSALSMTFSGLKDLNSEELKTLHRRLGRVLDTYTKKPVAKKAKAAPVAEVKVDVKAAPPFFQYTLDTVVNSIRFPGDAPKWYRDAHKLASEASKSAFRVLRLVDEKSAKELLATVLQGRGASRCSVSELVQFYCRAADGVMDSDDYGEVLDIKPLSRAQLLREVPSINEGGEFFRRDLRGALNRIATRRAEIAEELNCDDEDDEDAL